MLYDKVDHRGKSRIFISNPLGSGKTDFIVDFTPARCVYRPILAIWQFIARNYQFWQFKDDVITSPLVHIYQSR